MVSEINSTLDHIPDGSSLDTLFVDAGTRIESSEAERLEHILEADENALFARLQLIGYYFYKLVDSQLPPLMKATVPGLGQGELGEAAVEQARHKHLLWMIDHRASDDVCGTPYFSFQVTDTLRQELRTRWIIQLRAHPNNTAMLMNAGHFLLESEEEYAESLYTKARQLNALREID